MLLGLLLVAVGLYLVYNHIKEDFKRKDDE